MALPFLTKLPPLETPLDYPDCLDRIVLAAEFRANYEILMDKIAMMILEDIDNGNCLLFQKPFMPNMEEVRFVTDYNPLLNIPKVTNPDKSILKLGNYT